jgi:hypothetical protein
MSLRLIHGFGNQGMDEFSAGFFLPPRGQENFLSTHTLAYRVITLLNIQEIRDLGLEIWDCSFCKAAAIGRGCRQKLVLELFYRNNIKQTTMALPIEKSGLFC